MFLHMLLSREWDYRSQVAVARMTKNTAFRNKVYLEEIDYNVSCGLDRKSIMDFDMNNKGEALLTRAQSVTIHTARRSDITNMYLSHKFTIVQMMHVSGHKTQKTFMDYI